MPGARHDDPARSARHAMRSSRTRARGNVPRARLQAVSDRDAETGTVGGPRRTLGAAVVSVAITSIPAPVITPVAAGPYDWTSSTASKQPRSNAAKAVT